MVHLKPPFHLFCVGPTVRIPSVHRFAASLLPAGPPTPFLRRAHRPDPFGTPLRGLPTSGRSPPPFFLRAHLPDPFATPLRGLPTSGRSPPRRHLLGCLRRCP